MIAFLAAHTGAHAVSHAAPIAALPLIFRRAMRMPWRKPAAPAGLLAAGAATPPDGLPVLGDYMLSDVRARWDAVPFLPSELMSTAELTALDARFEALRRPVNGRSLGDQPRLSPVPYAELGQRFAAGRPPRDVVERVLAGLRKLDVTA